MSTEHSSLKRIEQDAMPKASHGYGGKFGVQEDRMDKVGLQDSVVRARVRGSLGNSVRTNCIAVG